MTISSMETILLTCIFIAPGFVIDGIVNAFSPHGQRKEYIYFLYCFLYSVVHCAIFSWAYLLTWTSEIGLTWRFLIMCGVALIGASILGILIGLFKSRNWIRKLLNSLNCNVSNPIPTAWDYVFSKQKPSFIIVTLSDGKKVYGLYGYSSFSSSNSEQRDIFIEKTYTVDEDYKWIETPKSLGIYLPHSQIVRIEFLEGGNCNVSEKQ